MDAVHVSHWTWDGKARRREETALQRFPDAQESEPEAMV
jgi:hypothetical protein